jgi:hypothetical protein
LLIAAVYLDHISEYVKPHLHRKKHLLFVVLKAVAVNTLPFFVEDSHFKTPKKIDELLNTISLRVVDTALTLHEIKHFEERIKREVFVFGIGGSPVGGLQR